MIAAHHCYLCILYCLYGLPVYCSTVLPMYCLSCNVLVLLVRYYLFTACVILVEFLHCIASVLCVHVYCNGCSLLVRYCLFSALAVLLVYCLYCHDMYRLY
jgi:hypothetical protein